MVHGGQAQADDGTEKEDTEHQFVLPFERMIAQAQDIDGQSGKYQRADQVSPDIGRLRVQSEQGVEARFVRFERRSMSGHQIVVVLQPVWQVVEVTGFPCLPCITHVLLCLFSLLTGLVPHVVHRVRGSLLQ